MLHQEESEERADQQLVDSSLTTLTFTAVSSDYSLFNHLLSGGNLVLCMLHASIHYSIYITINLSIKLMKVIHTSQGTGPASKLPATGQIDKLRMLLVSPANTC